SSAPAARSCASPSSSSTSTTSRRSTTASATRPATSCSSALPAASARRCATPMPWRGSAAVRSPLCSRAATRGRARPSPGGRAGRLLESPDQPMVVESTEIFPRASIGIALGGAGASGASLLREADAAMYDAKSAGKGRYSTFRPELHAAANEALALKADLIRAITSNELDVHYQPIVRLSTGQITGFEALTRWQHEERGAISPAE